MMDESRREFGAGKVDVVDSAVFNEVWESSRWNEFSWCLPAVLVGAVLISLWACRMKSAGSRRFTKILLLAALPIFATLASSVEIERKWQLRWEFSKLNWESFTEDQERAAIADGANRVMGPVIMGGFPGFLIPFVIFVVAGGRRARAVREERAVRQEHTAHGGVK
jgi:hypothetical protein